MSEALADINVDHAEQDIAEAENMTTHTDDDELNQLADDYLKLKSRCGAFHDAVPTCTVAVPVMIGTKIVAMELDTGSEFNMINQQLVDSIRQVAPDCVRSIQVEHPVQLDFPSNQVLSTAVEIKMFFGSEILRMPFYMIETETAESTLIMGRISMAHYKMTLFIHKKCAGCRLSGKKPFLVPYLSADQFADALSVSYVEYLETYTRDEIAQQMGIKRLIRNTYYLI